MKKLRYLAAASLILLICSGIYGIIIGINSTNEYLSITEAELTTGTLIFDYFLGVFRGVITLVCGVFGLVGIRKGDIKAGHLVFLGILTLLYVLGMIEYPYLEEVLQFIISALCLASLTACKFSNRPSPGNA